MIAGTGLTIDQADNFFNRIFKMMKLRVYIEELIFKNLNI